MSDQAEPIPPDDLSRELTIARPEEDPSLPHIEFFTLVGQPVATRVQPPAPLDADEQAAFIAKSASLAPRFRTELLPPGYH